jgi:osmoprotectant transport system ATP-binding protein
VPARTAVHGSYVREVAAAIELRDATRRYGGVAALGPVTLSIAAGTTVALIGPSGAGKSTALRLLLGLERPDAGEVLVGGAPAAGRDWAARRRLGYVVQGGGLFPHLTAERNVTLVARHLRWDRRRVAERVAALARLARLDAATLARFPRELSGGQAQRVSLMRALMLDPEVLLLDEPLGALDPLTRAELQDDLRRAFADLGKTVVVVTHDLAEAAFLARDLVLLRDGRVAQRGSIEDLVHAPADEFVARFVGAQRSLHLEPPLPPRSGGRGTGEGGG